MDRRDEIILELARCLDQGCNIMYDYFCERPDTMENFYGHVPPEIRWAERAKTNVKQARSFIKRNSRGD